MSESEWRGEGLAELQEKVDAFQDALHELVTEAIADHLPARDVIDTLKAETNHRQHLRYFPNKELNDER